MSANFIPRRLRKTNNVQIQQDPKFQKLKNEFDDKWKKLEFQKITEVMHLDHDNSFLYR